MAAEGDHLRRINTGDRFRPSAKMFNAFIDAARAVRSIEGLGGDGESIEIRDRHVTLAVKNSTGADLPIGGVVDITTPVFTVADNLAEFQLRTSLVGSVPSSTTLGRIGITAGPIPSGRFGRVVVAGVAAAKVSVTDANAIYAREISGDATKLVTSAEGGIPILWRESGSSGDKWALVLLTGQSQGATSPSHIIISASLIGGSSPSAWKYTIKRGTTNATTGAVTVVSGAPTIYAYNDFEDQTNYAHGQSLTLASGAVLAPSGPVEGPVEAWFSGTYDGGGVPIYRFDAPTPMEVTCE